MDGGRRVLRSLAWPAAVATARARTRPREHRVFPGLLSPRFDSGAVLAFVLVGGAWLYGLFLAGGLESLSREHGAPRDILARALGFGVSAVTISGQRDLTEMEILQAGGVSPKSSLLFLDVERVRAGLLALPLVREAGVRKLYPDRLMITLVEREPYALWQRDGQVALIGADGAVIDQMRDQRFVDLPFVAGEGANARVGEYAALLEAAGTLRPRIRAGVLIGKRRWNLRTHSGVDIKLPEQDPKAALAALAQLDRDGRILSKDILAVDLRQPDRVTVRLTAEAASARADARGARKPGKGRPNET